jgi:heme exporter protein CcmD
MPQILAQQQNKKTGNSYGKLILTLLKAFSGPFLNSNRYKTMDTGMEWLKNPQADYVLAAYGVAMMFLLGLLLASWANYRHARRKLERRTMLRDHP